MLKGTPTTLLPFIFLCLLSSVSGDESFPGNEVGHDSLPFLASTFKEICVERPDPLFCQYWDVIRRKLSEPEFSPASKPEELAPENRTSGKQEESFQDVITIEVPFVGFDNNQEKRFAVFRRRTPTVRGYKRGPGFRSWGGKRDLNLSGEQYDKKSKFASWGGKRDAEVFPETFVPFENEPAPDKRPKFQNWGGKRNADEFYIEAPDPMDKRGPMWKDRGFYLSEPFKKHVPKRPQFQSWGGKRALFPWHEFFRTVHPQPRFFMNGGEKRKFSSWGGKRFDDLENQKPRWGETEEETTAKRHVFQNWGGKRGGSEGDSDGDPGETGKARRKREAGEEPPFDSSGGEPQEWKPRR